MKTKHASWATVVAALSLIALSNAFAGGNAHLAGGFERTSTNSAGTQITVAKLNVMAIANSQGVRGHFRRHTVVTDVATGNVVTEGYVEADIYQLEVQGNTAYIAAIFTVWTNNGVDILATQGPGRLMQRFVDNGEGENAAEDAWGIFMVAPESVVQDPARPPWDVNAPWAREILNFGNVRITQGNIVVRGE